MLNHHTLSEDLTAGRALGYFYEHLNSDHKNRTFYRIIEMSEHIAMVKTYDINGFSIDPLSNKDFNVRDNGKLTINLECFLQDRRAEFFKIKRFSYRTLT